MNITSVVVNIIRFLSKIGTSVCVKAFS